MNGLGWQRLKAVLLDMDGVLWRGDQPILDIPALFSRIENRGLQVFCLTNNSTRSVESYLEKLRDFGVVLHPRQILTSAEAAADYLSLKYPRGGPVYVVGENGLVEALSRQGFRPVSQPETDPVLAVVAGLDRSLSYQKIRLASLSIQQGALFIGTNPDRSIPTPQGNDPGAGAVISAIEAASDHTALVIGKPQSPLYKMALQRACCEPREALMIGDRLETDILGAQNMGLGTALVLSGISGVTEARTWRPEPDIIADDALAVIDRLET